MSKWLNTKIIRFKPSEIRKPCYMCGFCPYGQLVEEFRVREVRDEYSCEVFGHDCPVYYHAEGPVEEETNPKLPVKDQG